MTGAATVGSIKDRIWLTSRARMISERKALRNQTCSYLAVTYYSLFVIIISLFSDYYRLFYGNFEEINISASVVVLAASLVAGGFRFETRAAAFRECYLRLQKLHGEEIPESDKEKSYMELLSAYPNHPTRDYYDFVLRLTLFEKKPLNNGDHALNWQNSMLASFLFRGAVFYASMIILFTAPIIFLTAPIYCSWGAYVAK
jgi:hypothetical protein